MPGNSEPGSAADAGVSALSDADLVCGRWALVVDPAVWRAEAFGIEGSEGALGDLLPEAGVSGSIWSPFGGSEWAADVWLSGAPG